MRAVVPMRQRAFQFIPFKLHDRQLELLSNARSLTDRVFTKAESDQNLELATCQDGANAGMGALSPGLRRLPEERIGGS